MLSTSSRLTRHLIALQMTYGETKTARTWHCERWPNGLWTAHVSGYMNESVPQTNQRQEPNHGNWEQQSVNIKKEQAVFWSWMQKGKIDKWDRKTESELYIAYRTLAWMAETLVYDASPAAF